MKRLNLTILALALACTAMASDWRELASTPPMGWNSFNCFGASVYESEVKANADFISDNLKQFGWEYVVVDFCWFYPTPPGSTRSNPPQFRMTDNSLVPWFTMDEYGRIYPSTMKFPSATGYSGFKELGNYIHSKGLKFGLHIMRGIPRQAHFAKSKIKGAEGVDASMIADTTRVCTWLNSMYGIDMTKKGAQEYYDSLFELYAEWGVDFVKYDDMSNNNNEYYSAEVEAIRSAIDKCGRPIVLSLSPSMAYESSATHINKYANMWRISQDFWDTWPQLLAQFDLCAQWNHVRSKGTWPDPDMLQLGRLARRGPVGEERDTRFTPDEQRTHFTMWCIYKSPLMMGGDLTVSTPETIEMLKNKDLLYINQQAQDPREAYRDDKTIIWTTEHAEDKGTRYVAIFNISDEDNVVKITASDYIKGKYTLRDIWANGKSVSGKSTLSVKVPAHGVVLYEMKSK